MPIPSSSSSSSLEKISSDIRLAESNKHNLGKALEKLHAYSSEVLFVTVQWKDLQDLFDLTQASIQHEFDELVTKTLQFERNLKEFEERERSVEQRFKDCQSVERDLDVRVKEFEGRLKGIRATEQRINEHSKECEIKEENLISRVKVFEAKEKVIVVKEKEVDALRKAIEKQLEGIEIREKELKAKQGKLVLDASKIDKKFKVIAKKEKEVEVLREENQRKLKQIELKEKEIKAKELEIERVREEYEKGVRELQLEEREFEAKEKRVEELLKGGKEKELVVEKRLNELQSKEKEFEEKEKRFHSSVASVEERLKSVRAKELEIDAIGKGYEKLAVELKSKEKEFDDKEKRLSVDIGWVKERFKVVEEKEKELELTRKRLQCEKNDDENLVQKVYEDSRKRPEPIVEVKTEPREARAMHYIVDSSSPNIRFVVTMDGKNLQLFLNEREKHHSLMKDEVLNALKLSSDPAKLVLDAMEGFYPPHLEKGFVASVIQKSCILLLEQLMRIPRRIGSHVEEAALKLAIMWKSKMSVADGSPEVLAFLLLVCSYKLAFAFAARELLFLVSLVGGYKQVAELLRGLGLAEMVVASLESFNESRVDLCEIVYTLVTWVEQVITSSLVGYTDFHNSSSIIDTQFIDGLVKKNNWLTAVRLIGAVGLVDKYPVVEFLSRYIGSVKTWKRRIYGRGNQEPDVQIMALNKILSSLRDVLACIMDCKVDCHLSLEKLNNKIEELERLKENIKVDENHKAMEKCRLDEKRKAKAKAKAEVKAKAKSKYLSRTTGEPRQCQSLQKEKLSICTTPATTKAAVQAAASFMSPVAPCADSKSTISDAATTVDIKSAVAETTTPPVEELERLKEKTKVDENHKATEKRRLDEKCKAKAKLKAKAKYLSRTTGEPRQCQSLQKEKLCICSTPATTKAAVQAGASSMTPVAPCADSKSTISDHATTVDTKSAVAETTTPPVIAATGSRKKHSRDNAPAPTIKAEEQQRGRNKRPRTGTDILAEGAQIAAGHTVQQLPEQQAGMYVNEVHANTLTGEYGMQSYPLQLHMPRPHDFTYSGTHMAAAFHPWDSVGDPNFFHAHAPPQIEPRFYGRPPMPGSAFYEQEMRFDRFDSTGDFSHIDAPHYEPGLCGRPQMPGYPFYEQDVSLVVILSFAIWESGFMLCRKFNVQAFMHTSTGIWNTTKVVEVSGIKSGEPPWHFDKNVRGIQLEKSPLCG
ncbi:Frigida-like [Dillenia turbinata]|uniref:Frigida-like n=1 Tax=Dillenia turbinata TaxID=194707 RepID=A0AAN8U9T8_9MAGN